MAFAFTHCSGPALSLEPALYVVATPIGNLADVTLHAAQVLEAADVVLAEDTRCTRRLLDHLGLQRSLVSCHEHNEEARLAQILANIADGKSVALVSDAGTPLISDPGYPLVRALREQGVAVHPVPGACAAVAALSVSGLPCNEFLFAGFLPAKSAARRARLRALLPEPRVLVFYEAGRRVPDLLGDVVAEGGAARQVMLMRELTKVHEEATPGVAGELLGRARAGELELRGEFVVLVAPSPDRDTGLAEARRIRDILLEEMPPSRAAKLAARITGVDRRRLYADDGADDEAGSPAE